MEEPDPAQLRERAETLRAAGEIDDEVADLFVGLADQAEHIDQLRTVIDRLCHLVIEFDEQYGGDLPEPAAEQFEGIVDTARQARARVGDQPARSDASGES